MNISMKQNEVKSLSKVILQVLPLLKGADHSNLTSVLLKMEEKYHAETRNSLISK